MSRHFDYLYVFATIAFTVYGQLILKWRIMQFGPLPPEFLNKLKFLLGLLLDPAIFSGFAAAFFASLAWMAALTKLDLSHAYPILSLNFVLIVLLSSWILNEPATMQKALGVSLILLGIAVANA